MTVKVIQNVMEAVARSPQELFCIAYQMKMLDHQKSSKYCQHIFNSDEFAPTIPPVIKKIIETNHYDPYDIERTTKVDAN